MLKDFFFGLKKSAFMNKFAPAETRDGAFFYFKDKLEKAIKGNDDVQFNKIIAVLLDRFSVSVQNSIKDAEEKNTIKDFIISLGDRSIEPVKSYIAKSHIVAHPIEILFELMDKDSVLTFLNDMLTTDDTLFDDPVVEKRIEVLKHFAGETNSSVLSKAGVYLNDSDDRLVIASIRFVRDYVFADNDPDMDKIQEVMLNKFIDEETSMRIKIELLNVFMEQNWKVQNNKKKIEEILPEGYFINAQGYIRVINSAVKARED